MKLNDVINKLHQSGLIDKGFIIKKVSKGPSFHWCGVHSFNRFNYDFLCCKEIRDYPVDSISYNDFGSVVINVM